ncbi:MAG: TldD/PmbA family protein [Synergistaceae bacterium]|nr:TldD/PmbA family protein [Synergistaceae bacterium]
MSRGIIGRGEAEAMASWLLDQATQSKEVRGADTLYFFSESHSLSLLDGEPEENASGVSGGVSLRLIGKDGRQGVAYGNNFSKQSLENLLEWSLANMRASEPEENITLFGGPIDTDDSAMELFDDAVAGSITQEMRLKTCLEMTDTARSRDPRVVSVRAAAWDDGSGESFYASSAGLCGWKRSTSVSCGATVVMQDGDSLEMGAYGKGACHLEDIKYQEYALLAVDKTARLLGGKPLGTGKYTLILPPEISACLVDGIGDLFCASLIHKGHSLMKGKLGTQIAGNAVTLTDDARIRRGAGSGAFDGEGVPTGKTVLIDSGVAANYLYNLQYAAKDGVLSTGNASRGLGSLPDVGTSNLVLSPGDSSRDALYRGAGDGFLVLELMGLHTLNPVSGDFSLGAKGVRMRDGVLGEPVAGVTISGNLTELLQKIAAVGGDLEFFGATGAPSIVVEDVVVAGN